MVSLKRTEVKWIKNFRRILNFKMCFGNFYVNDLNKLFTNFDTFQQSHLRKLAFKN